MKFFNLQLLQYRNRKLTQLNKNAPLIKGVICGYRIEEIEEPLTQQVRFLDKLVDELARGRKMEKILRKE
ncbi:DUF2200 domain-containing protein [Mesonia sp. K4-1]|nr:DUF2200 domain-containing protein [Mesonia sp. K4-1]